MKSAALTAAYFLLFLARTSTGAETKTIHVVLVCTCEGRTEVKHFENARQIDKYRKELDTNYRETVALWKQNGAAGPEPEKYFFRKLGMIKSEEIDGEKYRHLVQEGKKKAEKEIGKIVDNVQARIAAQHGAKSAPGAARGPQNFKDRRIPERRVALIEQPGIVLEYAGAFYLTFWAAAEPPPGKDPFTRLRLIVSIKTEISAYMIGDRKKELEAAMCGLGRFRVDKTTTSKYDFGDHYPVEIVADGKWREYKVSVEWEFLRGFSTNVSGKEAGIAFSTDAPGIYYLDDVTLEPDLARMSPDDIKKIERRRDDDGEENKDKKVRDKRPAADEKLSIGRIPNGDFNQVFDEFVLNWKREEPDYEAEEGREWSRAVVIATRIAGHRGQSVDERKNTSQKKKGEAGPGVTGGFYVKCDATRYVP